MISRTVLPFLNMLPLLYQEQLCLLMKTQTTNCRLIEKENIMNKKTIDENKFTLEQVQILGNSFKMMKQSLNRMYEFLQPINEVAIKEGSMDEPLSNWTVSQLMKSVNNAVDDFTSAEKALQRKLH